MLRFIFLNYYADYCGDFNLGSFFDTYPYFLHKDLPYADMDFDENIEAIYRRLPVYDFDDDASDAESLEEAEEISPMQEVPDSFSSIVKDKIKLFKILTDFYFKLDKVVYNNRLPF